ncbi:hypothetical protein ACHWUR_00445 [Klebsiella pneumoniae]
MEGILARAANRAAIQQRLPRSADAPAEWLGRNGRGHPDYVLHSADYPRPLRHALRRLQQARLGHAEGRRGKA